MATEYDAALRPDVSDYPISELAAETHMVMHVEQITGGAAVECHCGRDATLYITSEPDMEPGPVCNEHAWQWMDATMSLLGNLFPRP